MPLPKAFDGNYKPDMVKVSAHCEPDTIQYFKKMCLTHGWKSSIIYFTFERLRKACESEGIEPFFDCGPDRTNLNEEKVAEVFERLNFNKLNSTPKSPKKKKSDGN